MSRISGRFHSGYGNPVFILNPPMHELSYLPLYSQRILQSHSVDKYLADIRYTPNNVAAQSSSASRPMLASIPAGRSTAGPTTVRQGGSPGAAGRQNLLSRDRLTVSDSLQQRQGPRVSPVKVVSTVTISAAVR